MKFTKRRKIRRLRGRTRRKRGGATEDLPPSYSQQLAAEGAEQVDNVPPTEKKSVAGEASLPPPPPPPPPSDKTVSGADTSDPNDKSSANKTSDAAAEGPAEELSFENKTDDELKNILLELPEVSNDEAKKKYVEELTPDDLSFYKKIKAANQDGYNSEWLAKINIGMSMPKPQTKTPASETNTASLVKNYGNDGRGNNKQREVTSQREATSQSQGISPSQKTTNTHPAEMEDFLTALNKLIEAHIVKAQMGQVAASTSDVAGRAADVTQAAAKFANPSSANTQEEDEIVVPPETVGGPPPAKSELVEEEVPPSPLLPPPLTSATASGAPPAPPAPPPASDIDFSATASVASPGSNAQVDLNSANNNIIDPNTVKQPGGKKSRFRISKSTRRKTRKKRRN